MAGAQILGLEKFGLLALELENSTARVGAAGSAAIRKTAAAIQQDAKSRCPVLTGKLRESITTTVTGDGRFSTITAEIGPTAFYGRFVEVGTSKMGPKPFLAPAFDQHAPELEQTLARLTATL